METAREELEPELESLIEIITPQIAGTFSIISFDDWSEIESFAERTQTYGLHKTLTNRNIKHATEIIKLAVNSGQSDNEVVINTVKSLLEAYDIMKERHDRYQEMGDIQTLIREKGKQARNSRKKDPNAPTTRSRLTLAENEVKFRQEITDDLIAMTAAIKRTNKLTDTKTVVILTEGDAPIPLVMAKAVEKRYPRIREILNQKIGDGQGTVG